MNDPILPDDTNPAPAAETPAPGTDRMDRLEGVVGELTQMIRSAAERGFTIPPPGGMPTPQAPAQTPDEFLNQLAADPQRVITEVAQKAFRDTAQATLNPTVMQVLDTASRQLLNEQQLKIDTQFGIGTFDAEFRPQLEKQLAQIRASDNPRGIADQELLDALVHTQYGTKFEALMDRRKTLENAVQRGHGHHLMPTGGVPRLRQQTADDIPNDVEQFLRDVEKSTGESIDRKAYAKNYYTGTESGPGRHRTSLIEFLKTNGASAETLKAYGGGQ